MRVRRFTVMESCVGVNGVLRLSVVANRHRDRLDFQPGQYVALGFMAEGRPSPMRCFSITSSPLNPYKLDFAIKIEGEFTRALAAMPIGTTVLLRGPYGSFTLDRTQTERLVLLAGGMGITPYMSMLRHAADQRILNRIVLLYSTPTLEDMPFRDELLDLRRRNPHFSCMIFVTRGAVPAAVGLPARTGRITAHALWSLTDGYPNSYTYFLCGSNPFLTGMQEALAENGTHASRILAEDFSVSNDGLPALLPRDHPTRLTYAVSAASLLLAVGLISLVDVGRYAQKYARVEAASKPVSASPQATHAPSVASQAVTPSSSPAPAPVSVTTPPPAISQPAPVPTPTPTPPPTPVAVTPSSPPAPAPAYQPPVTKVS